MAQECAAVRDGKVIEVLGTTEHECAQFLVWCALYGRDNVVALECAATAGDSIRVTDDGIADRLSCRAWREKEPNMIKISLDSRDSKHIGAVHAFVAREVEHNPNLNGASVVVDSDDYTCVNGARDAYLGASLLASVRGLIDDLEEC